MRNDLTPQEASALGRGDHGSAFSVGNWALLVRSLASCSSPPRAKLLPPGPRGRAARVHSSKGPAEIDASHFARVAKDAHAWLEADLPVARNSNGRGLRTSQSFFGRAFRKGKDSLQ